MRRGATVRRFAYTDGMTRFAKVLESVAEKPLSRRGLEEG
jgi:hypothetical protein